METIGLPYTHFELPAATRQLIGHCKDMGEEVLARRADQYPIAQFEPADGLTSWHLLNSAMRHLSPLRQPVFCEWGSGLGLVTMMASSLGMPATGIEIEEELVDMSRDIAGRFAIPTNFIHASIYPKDNPIPSMDYRGVDLFFAYPWPDQIAQMTDLFQQVAVSGAVFICYHGGRNFRVLRQ